MTHDIINILSKKGLEVIFSAVQFQMLKKVNGSKNKTGAFYRVGPLFDMLFNL